MQNKRLHKVGFCTNSHISYIFINSSVLKKIRNNFVAAMHLKQKKSSLMCGIFSYYVSCKEFFFFRSPCIVRAHEVTTLCNSFQICTKLFLSQIQTFTLSLHCKITVDEENIGENKRAK